MVTDCKIERIAIKDKSITRRLINRLGSLTQGRWYRLQDLPFTFPKLLRLEFHRIVKREFIHVGPEGWQYEEIFCINPIEKGFGTQ